MDRVQEGVWHGFLFLGTSEFEDFGVADKTTDFVSSSMPMWNAQFVCWQSTPGLCPY